LIAYVPYAPFAPPAAGTEPSASLVPASRITWPAPPSPRPRWLP